MPENKRSKPFDLEDRTLRFANLVRDFAKEYPKNSVFWDDVRQLIRSSGSVGANYIEANDSLSKKDFAMRIKICKKEAKESRSWLNLLERQNESVEEERAKLEQEAAELTFIFAAIPRKSES
ncbi:MAG: four helix bundle protein [Phycisphaerae bacterium]|nr:four helix bundle protein [Phycisphaerae bacterium]